MPTAYGYSAVYSVRSKGKQPEQVSSSDTDTAELSGPVALVPMKVKDVRHTYGDCGYIAAAFVK